MKSILERFKAKNIDDKTIHHAYPYLYKTFQTIAKEIAHDAYIDGYIKRVCDQLDAGLAGEPIGSHYKQEELEAKVAAYIDKMTLPLEPEELKTMH